MRYKAFGLVLESELELPELISTTEESPIDVEIRLGKVPTQLEGEVSGEGVFYQINKQQFYFHIDNIASYFLSDGKYITIELAEDVDLTTVRLFLLGSVLGALFHQRQILPLHASSIYTPHGAVLFCGYSGAGKSTTAAEFVKRGYPLIADDISVIHLNEEKYPIVFPGYPQQKLWSDSLEQLAIDKLSLRRVREKLDKYALPVETNFHNQAEKVHAIYILEPFNVEMIEISLIKGLAKLNVLSEHIYRRRFSEQLNYLDKQMPLMMRFIELVKVAHVKRYRTIQHVDALIDAIEEDFNAV